MIIHYVGIDISFKTATVAWQDTSDHNPRIIEIQQNAKGYAKLIRQLKLLGDPASIQVVMEATGTYWMKLAYAVFDAGFVVSVVNPIQPKYFAMMKQQRTKTDAVDAVMLMHFADYYKPEPWTPPLLFVKPYVNI